MTQTEFQHAVQNAYKPLKGYAFKLAQNSDDANDLVQETMLKAFRYRDKFADGTNLKGWLYTIMKNIFINNYRRKQNSRVISDDTDNQFYINSSSGASRNEGESMLLLRDINKAVSRLSEKLRIPFMLSFQGYKYEEIAKHLNIPLGTVKIRIHNARLKLQQRLKMYDPAIRSNFSEN